MTMKTTIGIDLTAKTTEVDPKIYGNFIEFIQDCINGGMWAELLQNRGFENPDANQDGVSDPWVPTGYNDLGVYTVDECDRFNSRYSQKLEILNHYGGYRGIAQKKLRLVEGETYLGHVWLKAEDLQGAVRLNILSRAERLQYSQCLAITKPGWNCYDFTYACDSDTGDGSFEIALAGTGRIWVDQASFMPQSAVDGVWEAVVRATRELKPGIIRFPGGCFADCYHWEDGIGPRDRRPTRVNAHWKGHEENNFGTDEYLRFCRNTGCEPLICVNFGSGTPEEAANWVEYCNGSTETEYGKMRAANGHPEPYRVRYWDIGNETFGDWEIGHCHAGDYAAKYLKFYEAMKAKDPTVKILACGGDGNNPSQYWNRTVLARTAGKLDYLALHFYAPQIGAIAMDNRTLYYGTVGAVAKYERIIRETVALINRNAALLNNSGSAAQNIKIAVTEWNTMYKNDSHREQTLEAAIFNAGMLNMFLRNSHHIEIGNFSDLVNGWQGGCIRCDQGKVHVSPSYYALQLYSRAGVKRLIAAEVAAESYDIEAVGHVEDVKDVPYVDAVCGLSENNELILFIVNRHLERETRIFLDLKGAQSGRDIRVARLSAANPFDINTAKEEKVKPEEILFDNYDAYQGFLAPPCSISRFSIPLLK